jgi:hypothetical protein
MTVDPIGRIISNSGATTAGATAPALAWGQGVAGSRPVVSSASSYPGPRRPIAGEKHDRSRGLAGELARAGDDAEASLILDSGCRVPLSGDGLRAFVVRAVNAPAERILTGEAASTGVPEPPADEPAPRWAAPHRAAAITGELAHWRDDTRHNTAGNREGVPVMLTRGGRSPSLIEAYLPSLIEAYVDGGAGVLHLAAGVRR